MSLARAVLIGNLTAAPESFADGKVCRFSIAVNERVKKNDEWQDYVSYFDIVVFGGQAKTCMEHLAKGRQVAVDCKARQERWTDDKGNKRYAVKFIADNVRFIGGKKDDNHSAPQGDKEIPF